MPARVSFVEHNSRLARRSAFEHCLDNSGDLNYWPESKDPVTAVEMAINLARRATWCEKPPFETMTGCGTFITDSTANYCYISKLHNRNKQGNQSMKRILQAVSASRLHGCQFIGVLLCV
jgi:hypothetical protein